MKTLTVRNSTLEKLLDLWRESSLIQGTIAITVTLTICALYLMNRDVPTTLLAINFGIIGFYFGQKTNTQTRKAIEALKEGVM